MPYLHGEEAKPIPGFENYDITNHGRVFNTDRDKLMTHSPTQDGDPTVGLVRDGVQYRRSVKVLVAEAFVRGKTVIFDTPIQIDGNKNNCHFMNLEWMPRWFAWEYTRQFNLYQPWYKNGPLYDVVNNVEYDNIFQAAIETVSLAKSIYESVGTDTAVFPGGEKYVYI